MIPRVHRMMSLLKRCLMGMRQGEVGLEHLDDYLNEFTFHFNRRKSPDQGKLFFRLLQQSIVVAPVPCKALIELRRSRIPQPKDIGSLPESNK
jgi:hypothetical protein